jgi:hypothetical protein
MESCDDMYTLNSCKTIKAVLLAARCICLIR